MFRKRMSLNEISYLELWRSFIQRSRMICAILVLKVPKLRAEQLKFQAVLDRYYEHIISIEQVF